MVMYTSVWNKIGKPFRSAFKFCKSHEQQIRDNKLFDSFWGRNNKNFWKEANSRRKAGVSDVEEIDGLNDKQLISEMFKNKFSQITGNASNQTQPDTRALLIDHRNNVVSMSVIKRAIIDLKCGIGFDGIHSNHLKKLNDFNLKYIKEFFNVCIRFSYIPSKMLDGVVKPRIKNKFGDASSSDNYREVMISSCLLKLFEYCILPIMMN